MVSSFDSNPSRPVPPWSEIRAEDSLGYDATHERAWAFLLELAARARLPERDFGVALQAERGLLRCDAETGIYRPGPWLAPETRQMLDLCLPLCLGGGRAGLVYAHLGQSLDGQIATASGASQYVTGTQNLVHMHRLRALADAVIVGAGTVEHDDPRLTTRLVQGPNPVRVVIDPSLRLGDTPQLFRCDAARSLVVCRAGQPRAALPRGVELVEVPGSNDALSPHAIIEALAARGLRRLFVEGGGVTISRFLESRALDRLHVTVCPVFIGRGKPGLVLPAVERMEQASRPHAHRYMLGEDVLFDCELARAR